MTEAVLRIIDPGLGLSLQDKGRFGWRRYGVPSSGPMDEHAAAWANQLIDNSPRVTALEIQLQGAKLVVLRDLWAAVTGGDARASVPLWTAIRLPKGALIEFPQNRTGIWIYLAIAGGFQATPILGSTSTLARGKLGPQLQADDLLYGNRSSAFALPAPIASRSVAWSERRDYRNPPAFPVWPAPQWNCFSEKDRALLFSKEWSVSSQSDRVGYRLTGAKLACATPQIISEPVLPGTIQAPADGQLIVTMRDGPTIGGYPKLGIISSPDLSWLAQCRPGQKIRFYEAPNRSEL